MNLILLNDGDGTYVNLRSNSLSAIDLALCSPVISPSLQWTSLGDHLTDHFPISIEFAGRLIPQTLPRRWRLRNANWDLYRQELGNLQLPDTDVNEATELISRELLAAAGNVGTTI
ncbi:hypothetical protein JTB14_005712 [Gonioctena quinquepunctata]|nr:hypothetical protein JTB14_005712 [Gonioctena quinquepunctata]